ncbi:hypothetical protein PHSY_007195 [Pseudozyma hubeiensis SY62]|uniref:Uncharacterized protein n=1 Tax=Pseudozyma hubeiensis (strain SY62) TaxID=1305764 RepID=R9PEA9_PSEHS|nr:hypothetical protein PHSY_007195 [Pseudozyma hubeiensis SY62]GAC99592.1 hypothetical protein PHSY_007195 [Pseudozyma hubeiensis SY62]
MWSTEEAEDGCAVSFCEMDVHCTIVASLEKDAESIRTIPQDAARLLIVRVKCAARERETIIQIRLAPLIRFRTARLVA